MSNQLQSYTENVDAHTDEILQAYKRTSRISIALFATVSFLGSVILFLTGFVFLDFQTLLVSSAVSLAISLSLTLFFTLVVDRARNRASSRAQSLEISDVKSVVSQVIQESTTNVSKDIVLRINQILEEEATRLVDEWPELLPQDYFPPSENSSPRFMGKLAQGLATTRLYMFRGASGRNLSSILSEHGRAGLICNILVVDPREPSALQVCAVNRYAVRGGKKTIKEFEAEIRKDIYTAVVQLFDLREHFRIEIRFCNDLLFYRAEIVDAGAFVSFYTGNKRDIYPPTYFYTRTKGGFYYEAFLRDFQQSWDYAKERFSMTVDTSEAALEEFLVRLGAADEQSVTEQIEQWRKSVAQSN